MGELKENELRIGNLVLSGGNVENIIASDLLEIRTISTDDFYKPLLLTKEWIKKLGGYIYTGWDDMKLVRFEDFDHDMFELELSDNGYFLGNNKIEFVHDLQNTYFYHNNQKKELTIKQ